MNKVIALLLLPREITQFEAGYLRRINRIALAFFAFHIPVFALIASANHTRPLLAAILATIVVIGPATAYVTLDNPRTVSVIHGVSSMFMGALLVHFGQGPAQIEMHFYFFALLAMCAVFGNPMVIVAATVAVALHHVVVWLVLPTSVFNYDAQWWVVGIHALFLVLEAVATCFIARSFFDNVIGLERIVKERTTELAEKNQDMRRLLDNVEQGFLTIDRSGKLATERSAALDRWFGAPAATATWFEYLETMSPAFAANSRVAWVEVADDVMPLEVTLHQMPHELAVAGSLYGVEYRAIGSEQPPAHFQVTVTEITDKVRSELAEEERREGMSLFERVLSDRAGLQGFVDDGTRMVDQLAAAVPADLGVTQRMLHTLKGNASVFGLMTIARICHALEDAVQEADGPLRSEAYAVLVARWHAIVAQVRRLLSYRGGSLEIDEAQYAELEATAQAGDPARILREVRRLRLEPTHKRLRNFADQSQQIATRLGKPEPVVRVEDHGVRLDPRRWTPFWSAFIHGVRNAIDHGIEPADERGDKPAAGTLSLRTRQDSERIVIEIEDDGRGIDWDGVRDRARRTELAWASPADLKTALFVSGMSTAQAVSEISGRGIGMGALLEATHALGGELDVISTAGTGTIIRMSFPSDTAFDLHAVALAS